MNSKHIQNTMLSYNNMCHLKTLKLNLVWVTLTLNNDGEGFTLGKSYDTSRFLQIEINTPHTASHDGISLSCYDFTGVLWIRIS